MKIQVVGINHRDAPLAVRERAAIAPERLPDVYRQASNLSGQEGLVVLSTCNRTEIYAAGPVALVDLFAWWEEQAGVPRGEFAEAAFWKQDGEAAQHLMRVASGIDSMVLGETQILGQVKDAYHVAQEQGAVGRLHRLFHYAFRAGKRAHSETDIGKNALSLGYAVVELSKKVFGRIDDRTVLVIGAGETGGLVARHLGAQGAGRLFIANRTSSRAAALAQEVGGSPVSWDELFPALEMADIVVSCTSAPGTIITREMIQRLVKGQAHKFRFFFDMAVPRDIDPAIQEVSRSIFLYDIDDVTRVVDANLAKRQREVRKVEKIITQETAQLEAELGASQVAPVIRSLREKAEAIRQEELAKALNRLPNLSPDEQAVVAETTRLIMNKFLNDAMVSMRSWGGDEAKRSYLDAVRELFRLPEETRIDGRMV
ncbi:glutamyl-tRNA reductase [Sulfobacillus harzensis]|uniref:glutamyl-tRNA reductase n=1 Tax=Sulfobacillus harzensis TaxID=2729629 RepID=UPI003084527B